MFHRNNWIYVLLVVGIFLIGLGIVSSRRRGALRYDGGDVIREKRSGLISVRSLLAERVMVDGSRLLRSRRFSKAMDAGIIAGLLDESSGYQKFLKRGEGIRKGVSEEYMEVAADAKHAGDNLGAERAKNLLKRLQDMR